MPESVAHTKTRDQRASDKVFDEDVENNRRGRLCSPWMLHDLWGHLKADTLQRITALLSDGY
jgi:hypothetical protein